MIFKANPFFFEMLLVCGRAPGVTGGSAALGVHNPLPGQFRVAGVSNAANDAGGPWAAANGRNLAKSHHPPLRYLRYQAQNPLPKTSPNSGLHGYNELLLTRPLAS